MEVLEDIKNYNMDTEQIPQFSEEELKNITDFFTLLVELDHKYFPENSE